MTRATCRAGRTEAGYTYVAMLVVLVAMALAAQVTFVPTGTEMRRAAEEELIFRGLAYARAIESYHAADPTEPQFPTRLSDLLEDRRSENGRHIRRLYTPGAGLEWEEIPDASGGIMGVSVTSPVPAFRRAQLPSRVTADVNSEGYTVWEFLAVTEGG